MSEDVLKVVISDMPLHSDKPPGPDDWGFDDYNIEYVNVTGWPLANKTAKVVSTLDNPNILQPIRMLISIFQESAGFVGNHVLKEQTAEIMAAIARNPRHEAVFTHVIFKPALEEHWQLVFSFNNHIKMLNSHNKVRFCNLNSKIVHKYKKLREKKLQEKLERGDIMNAFYLIGRFWIEYEEETGLGFNLNEDGKKRIRKQIIWFIKRYQLQALDRENHFHCALDIPKPLKETYLYQEKYQQLKSAEVGMTERLSCFHSKNSGTSSLELESSLNPTTNRNGVAPSNDLAEEHPYAEVSERRVVFQDECTMNIQLTNSSVSRAKYNTVDDYAEVGDTNKDDRNETEKLKTEVLMLRKQLEIEEMQRNNDALKNELLMEEIELDKIRMRRMNDSASEQNDNNFRLNHEPQQIQINEGYHQQEFGERQHSRPRDHEQSGQREERGRDYRSRSRDRGEREKSRGNQDRHRERSRGNQSRGDNSRWKPDRSEGYEDGRKRSRGYEERQNRSRNDHDHRQSTEGRDGREKSRGQRDQRKERSRSGREERDRSRSGREERDRSRIGGEGRYRSSEYLERIRDTHGDTRGRDEATGRILRDEYGEYISSEVPTTSREGESRYSQRSDERSRDYERSKSYYQDRKGRSRSLEEYNPPRARSSTLEDFEPSNNHGPMARAPNLITEAAYFDDAAWDTSRPSRQGGQNTYRSRSRERSSSSTQEKQRAFQNQWGADAGPKPRLDSLENDFAVKPSNPKLPGAQLPQPVRSFRTRNIFNPKKSDSKKSNYNEDEEEIPGLDLPKPQPEPIAPTKPLRGRVLYPGDSALLTSRNQSFSASGPSTSLNPPTAQFGRPLNEGPNGIWNQSTGQPGGWNQSAGGPGGLNQSTGPPEGWNQSSGPPGSWNQSAGPQGTWNQSTGPPGGWNQSAGPQGNWNQSTGPHGDWNQSAGAPGGLNQSTGPHGGWNQSSGPPGRFNTGQWNQPGMPVSPPVVPVPDPQKIVELQNYIKRQESSKQLNNYRINI